MAAAAPMVASTPSGRMDSSITAWVSVITLPMFSEATVPLISAERAPS